MEKLTLFKDCDVVIYDGDNELISNCVAKSMLTAREIAWSRTDIERPFPPRKFPILLLRKVATQTMEHQSANYNYAENGRYNGPDSAIGATTLSQWFFHCFR